VVGPADDFVDVLERQHAHDRAKDLILGDGHVILDVVKNGRLDEVALVADAITADDQLAALVLSDFHIAKDLIELFLGDLRALLGILIERITDAPLFGLLGEAIDKFAMYFLFYKESAAGRAALPAVEIDGVKRTGHGIAQVGVGENHV